jgi:hypothetical protein
MSADKKPLRGFLCFENGKVIKTEKRLISATTGTTRHGR